MTFLQLGHDCFLLQHEHSIFPVTTNLISHWSIKHFHGIRNKQCLLIVGHQSTEAHHVYPQWSYWVCQLRNVPQSHIAKSL